MPAACAARQARISPSPCCMPQSPIGARASGSATGSPTIVVRVLRLDTSTRMRWRSVMRRGRGGWPEGLLGIGAAVGIFEEGTGTRRRASVAGLDAGHGFHGHVPSPALTRLIAQSLMGRQGSGRPGSYVDGTALPGGRRLLPERGAHRWTNGTRTERRGRSAPTGANTEAKPQGGEREAKRRQQLEEALDARAGGHVSGLRSCRRDPAASQRPRQAPASRQLSPLAAIWPADSEANGYQRVPATGND